MSLLLLRVGLRREGRLRLPRTRVSHPRGAGCQCGDTRQRGNVTDARQRMAGSRLCGAPRSPARRGLPAARLDDRRRRRGPGHLAATDRHGHQRGGKPRWLTTVVARVSLNMLRSRRRHPEEPVGNSWPAPVEAARNGAVAGSPGAGAAASLGDPEDEAVLADSVGLALLVVLDTLTPAERLAFVLHDMFAMPFDEVGAVLGRSTDATRQLASRARRRVRGAPSPDRAAGLARQREVAAAFLTASRGGDFSALVALLDSDVTLTADVAAAPSGSAVTLHGAEAVARGAVLASGRAGESRLALV